MKNQNSPPLNFYVGQIVQALRSVDCGSDRLIAGQMYRVVGLDEEGRPVMEGNLHTSCGWNKDWLTNPDPLVESLLEIQKGANDTR
jgi:hypothetical protein